MSDLFTGECRGCGARLATDPPGEHENHNGVSVRCSNCGKTTCLRPEGAGRVLPTCPFYIGRYRAGRETGT